MEQLHRNPRITPSYTNLRQWRLRSAIEELVEELACFGSYGGIGGGPLDQHQPPSSMRGSSSSFSFLSFFFFFFFFSFFLLEYFVVSGV